MGKNAFTILGVLCLAVSFQGTAFSGTTSDTGPGCGLGKIAWDGSGADSQAIAPQLLMSTTNNTILPWQAFGITTGNFGCTNNGKLWAEKKTSMFATVNFDNLSQEMAQGHGEHLTSLAELARQHDATHDDHSRFGRRRAVRGLRAFGDAAARSDGEALHGRPQADHHAKGVRRCQGSLDESGRQTGGEQGRLRFASGRHPRRAAV